MKTRTAQQPSKVELVKKTVELVYGTLVSYRRIKDGAELERQFVGPNHAKEAEAFVSSHVRGLTDEEYAKLSKADKEKLVKERHFTPGSNEGHLLWMRKRPLWSWHSMQPIVAEQLA